MVVGNPPYITVKDKQENENYRKAYSSCSGKYALSVPFAERFFQLAVRGELDRRGSGYVGQITANSFMKREFGKKLIEEFFQKVDLTHVDRHLRSVHSRPRHANRDPHGPMPSGHAQTQRSELYSAFKASQNNRMFQLKGSSGQRSSKQIDHPGSESQWVSVTDIPRQRFAQTSLESEWGRCG